MIQYQRLLLSILESGAHKGDRTGTGTQSIFGHQERFDLTRGFPLVTGKFTPFKTLAKETFWFLSGSTNVKDLQAVGVKIWDEWADKETGDLGPIYSHQWRSWGASDNTNGIDQIADVIKRLKTQPNDRRMLVASWNVADLGDMALPPCHCLFQFYTRPLSEARQFAAFAGGPHGNATDTTDAQFLEAQEAGLIPELGLSCQLYQRSCDTFLGVPFNIASYALLTHLIAHCVGMTADEFIWTGGDVHLYNNHREQAAEYLERERYEPPTIWIDPDAPKDIDLLTLDHVTLRDYNHGEHIKGDVSI